MTSPGSPNYDLGTAHGRIKIDVDDRGTRQADRTLEQFVRTVKKLERQFATFQTSLNKMEREIKNLGRDFNKTEKDAKRYERATDEVDGAQVNAARSTSNWRVQLRNLGGTLSTASDTIRRAAQHARDFGSAMNFSGTEVHRGRREVDVLNVRLRDLINRLQAAANAANDFGGMIANALAVWYRWGQADSMGGFVRSFRGLPVAGNALGLLAGRMLGLNKAMKDIPTWQKSILKLVGAFQGAALAAKLFDISFNKIFRVNWHPLKKISDTVGEFSFHVMRAITPSGKLGEQVLRLNSAIRKFGVGAAESIAGVALMRQGLRGLADRFGFITKIKPAMLLAIGAAASVASAGVEVLGKGLVWIGNILNGLLNGVTQLAGGLLALPGLFATIGVAVGTLTAIFSGFKKIFEDLFKNMDDPEKFAEAMEKVPPQFRNLGRVLVDTVKSLKGLREEMMTTFAQGVDKDVEALAKQFMGPLRHGALVVSQAFVDTRSKIMDLLTAQQTVQDFGLAFTYASGTIRNLNKAIVPVGSGLRDIAVVGMEFIRNLSAGAEGLTQRFAEWAKVNRENGNLMRWMQNAVQGAKDLANGLWDLTKALWTILTMFANDSGDNALERFADSMEKFNNAVEKSAATGFIKSFGDAVRGLGTEKIDRLKEILIDLWDTLQDVIPVVQQISSAFSDVFVPALKLALEIVEQFFNFLDGLGLNTYIGWILGLAAGFKILAAVIGPIRNLIQIISGLGLAFAGFKKLASGVVDLLYYFGGAGQKAHAGLSKVGAALSGMIGPLTAVAAAFLLFIGMMNNNDDNLKTFRESLAKSAESAKTFKEELRDAFSADLGLSGKNVFDQIKTRTNDVIDEQKDLAKQVPGIWDNISNYFAGGRADRENESDRSTNGEGPNIPTSQTRAFNDLQKQTQDAAHAQAAFDRLGLSSEDLAGKITASDSAFNDFIGSLRNSGQEGGNEAADVLQRIRDEYAQTQAEFAKAGTGSVKLVQGIQAIADAAGDSSSKLDGLKTALQGLGLLQTSQLDAAFAYAKSIREIGDNAATLVDSSQPLNDILDAQTGLYNVNSVNAENLRNAIAGLASDFLNAAANGENVQEKWAQMQPALQSLASAFDIPIEKVRELAALEGAVPDVVSILVNVKGGDKIGEQLAAIVAKLQTTTAGQEITIPVVPGADTEKIKQAIESALGPVVGAISEDTITIKPGVDPVALEKLKAQLSQNGIALPGAPPPKPVTMPVDPNKPGPKPPYQPPPEAPKNPPVVAPAPADQAALDKANQTIADLKKQIDELNAKPVNVQIDTGTLDEVKSQIQEVKNVVADGKLEFTIIAKGYDETNYVLNTVKTTIASLIAEVDKIAPAFQKAFATTPMDSFASRMQALVSQMRTFGQQIVSEFAQGMLDSKQAIDDAGHTIAQAVQDYLKPGSPTKKGPLSGSGWTYLSGGRIVTDFASGMTDSAGSVASAGSTVAGGAAQALQGPYDFGKFLGRLQQLVAFGEHLTDVIGKAADTVFQALKFISDPTGSGKFFGQSPGAAFGFRRDPNISDEDLQKKRDDALQAKLSSAAASGTKDGVAAGLKDLPGAAGLAGIANPSNEEVAAGIIGEAIRRGYDRNTAIAAVSAALKESGLDESVTNATGHESLFQTSADKGVGHDAEAQINWFFDRLDALGGPSAASGDPFSLIADKIEIGGYSGADLAKFADQAANYYDSINTSLANSATNLSKSSDAMASAVPAARAAGDLSRISGAGKPTTANIQAFLDTLGLGLKASTYTDNSDSYHNRGMAWDITGNKQAMDTFARIIAGSFADQTLELIWDNAGFDQNIKNGRNVGAFGQFYTMGQAGDHSDHVHWATDVAPVLSDAIGRDVSQYMNTNYDPTTTQHGLGAQLGPDLSDLTPDELAQLNTTSGLSLKTQDQMLAELRQNNSALDQAITVGQNPDSTDAQVISSLSEIQRAIDSSATNDTAMGRQQTQSLESIKSSIMGERGITEGVNPIDAASSIASGATSIAKDIFGVINSSLDAIGGAKNIADTLVRGIENSEDIYNMVDEIQKFIDLAARVAGAVSSVSGTIGGIVSAAGGADPSGGASGAASALQGISAISGIISGALDTVNGIIDLTQEAYRIFGTYFGEFLGFLAGGTSQLEGNVKFLLDENDKTLKAYSQDNPLDKREHALPGQGQAPEQQPAIGELNVFPERGADPAELTRTMMFAVKTAGMGSSNQQ